MSSSSRWNGRDDEGLAAWGVRCRGESAMHAPNRDLKRGILRGNAEGVVEDTLLRYSKVL